MADHDPPKSVPKNMHTWSIEPLEAEPDLYEKLQKLMHQSPVNNHLFNAFNISPNLGQPLPHINSAAMPPPSLSGWEVSKLAAGLSQLSGEVEVAFEFKANGAFRWADWPSDSQEPPSAPPPQPDPPLSEWVRRYRLRKAW